MQDIKPLYEIKLTELGHIDEMIETSACIQQQLTDINAQLTMLRSDLYEIRRILKNE